MGQTMATGTSSEGTQLCKYPGCDRNVWQSTDGQRYEFCCRTHGKMYAALPKNRDGSLVEPVARSVGQCKLPSCTKRCFAGSEFCDKSHYDAYKSGGMVLERPSIMQSDDSSVVETFLTTWTKKPQSGPRRSDIRAVFSIRNAAVERKFQEYVTNLRGPNIGWFYHGTVLKCDILRSKSLCDNYSCSVCGISCRGFDPARIRSHVNFQRFGHAFYLGENSSKCHEYSEGYNGVRALLYCKVAMGNRYYAPTDEPDRKAPPPGYDSVYGQKGTHHGGSGSLNYNEVAIYGISEAILPMYIIVYQNNGVKLLL